MAGASSSAPDAGQRRLRLGDLVESRGFCTISELAQLLDVSEMTVRRDVLTLVESGRLRSFHGGVGAPGGMGFLGTDYALRSDERHGIKTRIGARAVQLAEARSVIAIDSGTTGAALAAAIPESWRLRVVTTSLPVIAALNRHSGVEVTAFGGVLHVESQSFFGVRTTADVKNVHVEVFFLTASAASQRGVYCTYELGAAIKRAFIEVADQVVLVADSSKFSTGAMTRISGWDRIGTVITDTGLSAEMRAFFDVSGIDLVTVDADVAALAAVKTAK